MHGVEPFDAPDDTKKFIFLMTRCETFGNSLFANIFHIFLLNHLISIKNPTKPSLDEIL